jgi:hypothetical protein
VPVASRSVICDEIDLAQRSSATDRSFPPKMHAAAKSIPNQPAVFLQ